jgi:tetratricopeptide (TPR) repeat protein
LTLGIALESSQQQAAYLRQRAEQNRLEAEKADVLRRAAEQKSQSDAAAAAQAEAQRRRLEVTQSALAEARDLERRGATREAIMKQIELALSSSARSAPTLLSAAELLLEMGQREAACRLLEEASVEPPTAYRALTLLHGHEQARTGRLRTGYVDRLIEMARARGDRNEMSLFADAHIAFDAGDFEGCLKLTTEVQRMVEPWAGLWVLHGNALVRLGRMKESLEVYAKALESEPGHRLSRANRATVLFKLGRTDEAEAELKILLREDPKDATAHASLGAIARLRGQILDSVPLLERACELDPDHDEAFVNLLLSLLAIGRIDELESWFQKLYPRLAARAPSSPDAMRLRIDAIELIIAARLERGDGAGASSAVAEALSLSRRVRSRSPPGGPGS